LRPVARSRRQIGQSITEFALVFPLLLFLLFGVLEAGLLMFSVGTARMAAGEAARQVAESGNAANADVVTLKVVRGTALGTTTLASVDEIDIQKAHQQPDGSITLDVNHINQYTLAGGALNGLTWPANTRDVINGQTDFAAVTIRYTYTWKSGIVLGQPPLHLFQTFYVRLEPQTY
jgi:Flp pilus assembly protein TadG